MDDEEYRWLLVEDHINNFNDHRSECYLPSHLIVVDESISRWYGHGGYWINFGLPHYVALDQKPENGCEIQNSCDAVTGVMLRLKLVKTAKEEENDYQEMVEMCSKAVQESIEQSDSTCQTDEFPDDESNTSDLGRGVSEPSSPVNKETDEEPSRVRVFLKDLLLYLPIAYQMIMCLPQDTVISIDRILNTAVIGGGLHFLAGGFDKNLIDKYLLLLGTTGLCKLRTHPLLYQSAYIDH